MGCDILWILFVCCSNRKICEEGKVYWLVKDIFCLSKQSLKESVTSVSFI